MNEQFRFRKDEKTVLGAGDYSVDNDEIGSLIYTGMYQGDEIVALLVVPFDEGAIKRLLDRGDFMVRACNSHEQLVAALRHMTTEYIRTRAQRDGKKMGEDWSEYESIVCVEAARAALAAAGV